MKIGITSEDLVLASEPSVLDLVVDGIVHSGLAGDRVSQPVEWVVGAIVVGVGHVGDGQDQAQGEGEGEGGLVEGGGEGTPGEGEGCHNALE